MCHLVMYYCERLEYKATFSSLGSCHRHKQKCLFKYGKHLNNNVWMQIEERKQARVCRSQNVLEESMVLVSKDRLWSEIFTLMNYEGTCSHRSGDTNWDLWIVAQLEWPSYQGRATSVTTNSVSSWLSCLSLNPLKAI